MTTSERDLHYVPDPEGGQVAAFWADRGQHEGAPGPGEANVAVPLSKAG